VFRGHDGLRASAHRLWKALGEGSSYRYTYALADDRMALLEWNGSNDKLRVRSGVDSFLIEDGWIRVQTIHYRVVDVALSTDGDLLDRAPNSGVQRVEDPDRLPRLTDD
jgi:hypothetical protein